MTRPRGHVAVQYYAGVDRPCIEVWSIDDLIEALDVLHTQVIDNIGDESPAIGILERAMIELYGDEGGGS
jgi:hypothetical protein